MPQGRRSVTTGRRWDRAVGADGDPATDTLATRLSFTPARRASYESQPLRELLKPILDELQDTLESFEGEPAPEDRRWLRGQLRKLVVRLDMA